MGRIIDKSELLALVNQGEVEESFLLDLTSENEPFRELMDLRQILVDQGYNTKSYITPEPGVYDLSTNRETANA